jgi:hypothetical protein
VPAILGKKQGPIGAGPQTRCLLSFSFAVPSAGAGVSSIFDSPFSALLLFPFQGLRFLQNSIDPLSENITGNARFESAPHTLQGPVDSFH